MTSRLTDKLSRLNVNELAFGLQSISPITNRNIWRHLEKESFKRNIQEIRQAFRKPPRIDIDVIFGLPGDDFRSYKETIEFALSCNATIYYQPLRIFPGAPITEDIQRFQILCDSNPPNNVLRNSTFSADDMIRALKLNSGLDYYQSNMLAHSVLDRLRRAGNLSVTDICERLGDHLWQHDFMSDFRLCNSTPEDRPTDTYFHHLEGFVRDSLDSCGAKDRDAILELMQSLRAELDSHRQDFNIGYYGQAI